MKAKITDKVLCIPPYLSVSWDQVTFLHCEKNGLTETLSFIVHLSNGQIIRIDSLEKTLIDLAFQAHMQYLEKTEKAKSGGILPHFINDQSIALPIRLGNGTPLPPGVEGIEMSFQHNPAQANSPLLPPEALEKIASIARIFTNGDTSAFTKPEPHCHCLYCQISASIHKTSIDENKNEEEVISEEDLKFRNWDILESENNLYIVTNPLHPQEQYKVCLKPVGCTCGSLHCEHIKAVLSS